MSREPEEERFGRQESRRYSGWSSAITIAVIVIILGIVILVYAHQRSGAADCGEYREAVGELSKSLLDVASVFLLAFRNIRTFRWRF